MTAAAEPVFARVLVGIDDGTGDRDAITFARAIAPQAALVLATAYSYEGDPSSSPDGYPGQMRVAALDRLAEVRDEAEANAAEVVAIGSGSPGSALRELAATRHADLLVVGATPQGPIGRVLLGDTARAALHGATCAVAVVPAGWAGSAPARIGVAFDRSPEAELALELAVRLAGAHGAAIEIVDAVELDDLRPPTGSQADHSPEDLRRGVEDALRTIAMDLPVPTTVHARLGRRDQTLAELASRVDLMLCGSRGRGPLARVTLGSASDALIHGSPCPVLVVPRQAGTQAEAAAEPQPATASTAPASAARELRSS